MTDISIWIIVYAFCQFWAPICSIFLTFSTTLLISVGRDSTDYQRVALHCNVMKQLILRHYMSRYYIWNVLVKYNTGPEVCTLSLTIILPYCSDILRHSTSPPPFTPKILSSYNLLYQPPLHMKKLVAPWDLLFQHWNQRRFFDTNKQLVLKALTIDDKLWNKSDRVSLWRFVKSGVEEEPFSGLRWIWLSSIDLSIRALWSLSGAPITRNASSIILKNQLQSDCGAIPTSYSRIWSTCMPL